MSDVDCTPGRGPRSVAVSLMIIITGRIAHRPNAGIAFRPTQLGLIFQFLAPGGETIDRL